MSQLTEHAINIFHKAVESVKPANIIDSQVELSGDILTINQQDTDLSQFKNIYVLGFGKAAAYMAKALEQKIGNRITDGAVLVKYGHKSSCDKIKVYEGGHPVPDIHGEENSKKLMEIAKKAGKEDLVICLISGGGSALFEVLPKKINFKDLQKLNDRLLSCGANISEINTVRRHVSMVKGGQLLNTISPARCIGLIISDVMNDPIEDIASGPTAPDKTTFQDARNIIEKYKLDGRIPSSVLIHLELGTEGKISETVKPDEKILDLVDNHIIGNLHLAMKEAALKAENLGYEVNMSSTLMSGEAQDMGKKITEEMKRYKDRSGNEKPVCLIYGGETTVKHSGQGKGGRNQELALSAIIELQDFGKDFSLLCAGTDGTDGPTDAAGAVISRRVISNMENLELQPEAFLQKHDSYTFFEKTDGLLKTGPTGTNVMDLVIALIG